MNLLTRRTVGRASLSGLVIALFVSTFSDSNPITVSAQDKTPQKSGSVAPAVPAKAEPTPPEVDGPVIVHTDLITLTVTVTDTYGRYVSGLSQSAFSVLDDKKPQEITYF